MTTVLTITFGLIVTIIALAGLSIMVHEFVPYDEDKDYDDD